MAHRDLSRYSWSNYKGFLLELGSFIHFSSGQDCPGFNPRIQVRNEVGKSNTTPHVYLAPALEDSFIPMVFINRCAEKEVCITGPGSVVVTSRPHQNED